MSKETMIKISFWAFFVFVAGILGSLLWIIHGEAVAAGKATTELERTITTEYVRETDLDKRLTVIEKKQDDMSADIKTLIRMHMRGVE
jgi:hypothetical protein